MMDLNEVHCPLIHGLPDEVAILCIARVPRQYFGTLRCVSRGWRALLLSGELYSCRQRNDLEETWIYVLCDDINKGIICYALEPSARQWKFHQEIHIPSETKEGLSIEAVGKKLYFLGGCGGQKAGSKKCYCYDVPSERWGEIASMPTARSYYVSASLEEKIFITGGSSLSDQTGNSIDIYDSVTNTWTVRKNPMLTPDIVKFLALNGQLITIHKSAWSNYICFAGVFNPGIRWRGIKNEIAQCSRGPTVVVDGTLYMLDESCGTKLMKWQKDTEDWVMLGRLSEHLTRPPCQLVAIGRRIYVIGRGLSTVAIDLDIATKVDGLLVCSSFPPISESLLLRGGCKAIAI